MELSVHTENNEFCFNSNLSIYKYVNSQSHKLMHKISLLLAKHIRKLIIGASLSEAHHMASTVKSVLWLDTSSLWVKAVQVQANVASNT